MLRLERYPRIHVHGMTPQQFYVMEEARRRAVLLLQRREAGESVHTLAGSERVSKGTIYKLLNRARFHRGDGYAARRHWLYAHRAQKFHARPSGSTTSRAPSPT